MTEDYQCGRIAGKRKPTAASATKTRRRAASHRGKGRQMARQTGLTQKRPPVVRGHLSAPTAASTDYKPDKSGAVATEKKRE
jgi:hypothetical protein